MRKEPIASCAHWNSSPCGPLRRPSLESNQKSPEAVQLIVSALERAPTRAMKATFAFCVASTRFAIDEPRTRAALTTAITEPWGMPSDALPASTQPYHAQRAKLRTACAEPTNRGPNACQRRRCTVQMVLAPLQQIPLLNALLQSAPVATVEFERFLTCARHALTRARVEHSSARAFGHSRAAILCRTLSAMLRQRIHLLLRRRELLAADACREKLLALLDANAAVPQVLLLAVAAYFPLYTLRDAKRLLAATESSPVDTVLRQQIREPLEEQALGASVDCLTSITDGVSEEVRAQYEQNPYPRWVKLPIGDQSRPFNDELRRRLPYASFAPLPDDSAPEVLVAGCGTGAHSILVAQRIRGARVLAIDLSLGSIGYAIRKTQELGITNIEYAQADILNVGDIARTFDVIESGGVLHHLADPFTGWRALLSRLRPGGFMGLGLYSEVARRHVVKARELIAARGYASSYDEIRRFRQDLLAQEADADMQRLTTSTDFFSTSECRDLLFHVQEHRLTLDQIKSFLTEFGLDFLGFELDPRVRHQYRVRFTDDPSVTNLRNWARFEADNPATFAGMYQFWIQKPIVA